MVPVATHELCEEQDTALRYPPAAPAGSGIAWVRHCAPFHVSVSGRVDVPVWLPTAAQAFTLVHDTDSRALALPGRGDVVTRHEAPVHISTKDCVDPELLSVSPTAAHHVVDMHETALSWVRVGKVGAVTTRQFVPFHISVSGVVRRLEVWYALPTAMQKVADGQEIPYMVSLVPIGVGAD